MRPQKRWINQGKLPLDRPAPGIPATHQEHLRLMLDIFILAFWTDTTRIGTFMLGDAQSNVDYSWLPGVKGAFHSISHHGEVPERKEQYGRIINWNIEQLAYFLNRMKSLDEGGGVAARPLDDHVRRLPQRWQPSLRGESAADSRRAAARARSVRDAASARRNRLRSATSMSRCLSRMGIQEKSFGDSTGALEGLS